MSMEVVFYNSVVDSKMEVGLDHNGDIVFNIDDMVFRLEGEEDKENLISYIRGEHTIKSE